jgi:hypothetical protein
MTFLAFEYLLQGLPYFQDHDQHYLKVNFVIK